MAGYTLVSFSGRSDRPAGGDLPELDVLIGAGQEGGPIGRERQGLGVGSIIAADPAAGREVPEPRGLAGTKPRKRRGSRGIVASRRPSGLKTTRPDRAIRGGHLAQESPGGGVPELAGIGLKEMGTIRARPCQPPPAIRTDRHLDHWTSVRDPGPVSHTGSVWSVVGVEEAGSPRLTATLKCRPSGLNESSVAIPVDGDWRAHRLARRCVPGPQVRHVSQARSCGSTGTEALGVRIKWRRHVTRRRQTSGLNAVRRSRHGLASGSCGKIGDAPPIGRPVRPIQQRDTAPFAATDQDPPAVGAGPGPHDSRPRRALGPGAECLARYAKAPPPGREVGGQQGAAIRREGGLNNPAWMPEDRLEAPRECRTRLAPALWTLSKRAVWSSRPARNQGAGSRLVVSVGQGDDAIRHAEPGRFANESPAFVRWTSVSDLSAAATRRSPSGQESQGRDDGSA